MYSFLEPLALPAPSPTVQVKKCAVPTRVWSAPSMLRVQKHRRPEEWNKKMESLSGRFLPLDPRDEIVLDVLEKQNGNSVSVDTMYGPEGPPAEAYGDSPPPGTSKKWSRRSEAARKRWADPAYRAKILRKRAEKRLRDAEEAGEQPKQHKVEIGRMDSITLCDDDKAKAINDYARSNKLRSEKVTAFHKNQKVWMEGRLSDSRFRMSDDEYIARKREAQEKRKNIALKRSARRKRNARTRSNGNDESTKS